MEHCSPLDIIGAHSNSADRIRAFSRELPERLCVSRPFRAAVVRAEPGALLGGPAQVAFHASVYSSVKWEP